MKRRVEVYKIGLGTIVERWSTEPARTMDSSVGFPDDLTPVGRCRACFGRRWVHLAAEGQRSVVPCEDCNRFAGLRQTAIVSVEEACRLHAQQCGCDVGRSNGQR